MKKLFIIVFGCAFLFMLPSPSVAQSAKEHFLQGEKSFSAGNYQDAITSYEKAIEADPNFAEAYNKLGMSYREMGMNLAEVAWYFKAAVDIKPDFAEAYINLARAFYAQERYDQAEEYCLKVLEMYPDLGSAHLSLGWTYLMGKKDSAKAIHHFKKVLSKRKIPYAYFGLGMAYFMNEQRAMVLEIITTLRSMRQDSLAEQLENIIRGHYYVSSQPGPMTYEPQQIQRQEGVIVPADLPQSVKDSIAQKSKDGEGTSTDETPSAPIGMTRIRLRGKLVNLGKPATEESQEEEESIERSTPGLSSDD